MAGVLAVGAGATLVVVGIEGGHGCGNVLHGDAGIDARRRGKGNVRTGGGRRSVGEANAPSAVAAGSGSAVGDGDDGSRLIRGVLARSDGLLALVVPIRVDALAAAASGLTAA